MSSSRTPNVIDANSQRARLPLASDKLSLMPHQEAMLHKAIAIENESDFQHARSVSSTPTSEQNPNDKPSPLSRPPSFAVMNDAPGSGKTFVVLALVLNEIRMKRQVLRRMGVSLENAPPGNDQSILVVPFNIYTQWEDSIRACCGEELRFKSFVNYQDISSLFFSPEVLKSHDVLLTTSLYYANIASTMESMKLRVRRVVFDEVDSISPLLSIPIACDHIWFVSASFNPKLLGDFRNKIDKSALEACTVRCDPDFVRDCITLPSPRHTVRVCYNHLIDTVFPGMLHPLAMTAVNARSFGQVRSKNVLKVAQNETQLLTHMLEDARVTIVKQKALLKEFAERKHNFGLTEEEQEREAAAKNELGEAYAYLEKMYARLESHGIDPISLAYVGNDPKVNDARNRANKVDETFSIIDTRRREEDIRVILFSDFPAIYAEMADGLQRRGIRAKELDGGNIPAMDATLNQYKNGDVQVLMVNSSMYGCGMNLENTTDIVFLHALPESRREQVVGRAQRYGRLGKLNVWDIYHQNELNHAAGQT